MISHEELLRVLEYNPETGLFKWRVQLGTYPPVGGSAGSDRGHGYLQVKIHRKVYTLHRLAYFYMTGRWPENLIDHINRVKHDNRWCNLRPATHTQNMRNRKDNVPFRSEGFAGPNWADIESYE